MNHYEIEKALFEIEDKINEIIKVINKRSHSDGVKIIKEMLIK